MHRAVGVTGIDGALGIEPFLHSAVIGGDERCYTEPPCLFKNPSDLSVDGIHGLENGGFIFDVAQNVDVGKVGDDQVVILVQFFDGRIRHFFGHHLRTLIIAVNVLAGFDADVRLPGKSLLSFPVHKKSDVNGLFCFRDFANFSA